MRKSQFYLIVTVFVALIFGTSVFGDEEILKQVPEDTAMHSENRDKALEHKFNLIQNEIKNGMNPANFDVPAAGPISSKKATGMFFKLIFGMIFIILLIILSIRWLKKLQKSPLLGKKGASVHRMEVLETCYLGKEQKVVLISMAGKEVALGVTAGNIQFLKEVGDVSPEEKLVPLAHKNKEMEMFRKNLNGFLSKYKKPKTVSESLKEL